jgi:excinuclease ABC subunit C
MREASQKTEYEKARLVRDKIQAIERITEKQDAVLLGINQDIDVIGYHTHGNEMQWVVLFVRAGFLIGRRAERIALPYDPEETMRSFLEQFYMVSLIPDEVWVPEEFADREILQEMLSEKAGKRVRVIVKRGEKAMRLLGMAQENAKLIYEEHAKRVPLSGAVELQKVLGLPDAPQAIEGIDVSNFQGLAPAIALVHFADERPLKSRYRLYYPKTVEGQNDFAMIYETVLRRVQSEDNPPPDLFVIDGGKGQLASAVKALQEMKSDIPVCALAKSRTQSAFTRKEIEKSEERIFIPNRKNPILLKEGNPALRLLQQVRDEAHRFSVKMHRARRDKWSREGSPLRAVSGIGEKSKEKLLRHFGRLEEILKASEADLVAAGMTRTQARKIRESLALVQGDSRDGEGLVREEE